MKYKVVSLFSGIGGIDLGFEQAGFKIIWGNDADKYACRTYRMNFPKTELVENDINNIKNDDIPDCDIIVAGFPCQAFSSVGLKLGFNDPRGNLFFETARIINSKKPKAIFLENVANLVKHDSGLTFKVILETLNSIGYYVKYNVMNASDYGIPQQRNRIYIVGFLNKESYNKFEFPEKIPLKHDAFYYLNKEKVDDTYYLDNHKKWEEIKNTVVDTKRIYRFTDWGISKGREGICPTLLAAMGSPYERIPFFKDKFSIRKITQKEAARLQGFPDNFEFPIQKTPKQVYKQIGNSVCVPIVKMIAKQIKKSLEAE